MVGDYFLETVSKRVIQVLELLRDGSVVFDLESKEKWQAAPIPLTSHELMLFPNTCMVEGMKQDFIVKDLNCSFDSWFHLHWEESLEIYKIALGGFWYGVKYVHDLQHLFFILTGQKLTYEYGKESGNERS